MRQCGVRTNLAIAPPFGAAASRNRGVFARRRLHGGQRGWDFVAWDDARVFGVNRQMWHSRVNAAEEALELCEAEISNKIIVDATNPISDEPPVNGVINYFTGAGESLMETLQTRFQNAKFVKAFSCVGSGLMVNPEFGDQRPSMFICGNDSNAKSAVSEILDKFGWEIEDMGEVEAARAIEPLAMLWCIPGFKSNQWNHAFKLLKK